MQGKEAQALLTTPKSAVADVDACSFDRCG
jgi:hypothetical protein